MGIAKITRNYQITIPKYIRELIKLKEGDKILFTIDGDKVSLIRTDKNIIENTAGIWADMKETGAEYQRRIRSGWKRRKKRIA